MAGTRPPGDYLNTYNDRGVSGMLLKHGEGGETVVFSDSFIKINRKDKQQDRAMLVTTKAVYNCKSSNLSKCKRRIALTSIEGITQSTVSDEFVLHVPSEYDYRFMGPRKSEAIEWIQTARERLTGKSIPVTQSSQVVLKSVTLTRVEAAKRKTDAPPPVAEFKAEPVDFAPPSAHGLGSIVEEGDDDEDVHGVGAAAAAAAAGGVAGDDERAATTGWAKMETSVTMDDFDLVKVLGRGSFGKVIAARKRGGADHRAMYAIKILNKKVIEEREQIEHTQAEREILESIDHPFLVGLKYAFQTPTKLYMVLPMYNGGELFTILKRERRFSEDRARFYAAEIAAGLGHLHSNGIIYRDLKPENLLLDTDGHIGITDFGLSKRVGPDEKSQTFCGTPEYLAPEIINDEGHDKNVDWWSFGILVYEMMAGRPPFYTSNHQKMYELITRGKLVFPSAFSPEAKDFLKKILVQDPAARLGGGAADLEEMKAHPFFAPIDWDKLLSRQVTPPFKPSVSGDDDFRNFDKEFTSEAVQDTFVPESTLHEAADAFTGFTFAGESAIGAAK